MSKSIEQLRRDAKALRTAYEAGDVTARQRIASVGAKRDALKHADFLHVIAREAGFESWPRLVWADETIGLDRAALQQRLKMALYHGQNWRVDQLLEQTPDLATDLFGLQCALYDLKSVTQALDEDPSLAIREFGPRRPILHLAFSRYIHAHPDLRDDMLAIASLLVANGADVNDGFAIEAEGDHKLSALYGAIGHGNNMALGRWLLEHGADPNDGESLYHATELGHHNGLKLLLDHGADPSGTNALLRAMDFDDVEAVRLLVAAGAQADEYNDQHIGGEAPFVIPALHQAARRMCSRKMVELLFDAGADPTGVYEGLTPYAFARIYGNDDLAQALTARGHQEPLPIVQAHLASIADGHTPDQAFLDPEAMPPVTRNIVRDILHLPGKLEHVRRLVAAGAEYDRPDHEGLTPVQVAGWMGLPDVVEFFLSQKPDLGHVNNYGGTLLSTIIHGSENNPDREEGDYLACLGLVLKHGVALPSNAIDQAGDVSVSAFLADWAEAHPGQVVAQGVA